MSLPGIDALIAWARDYEVNGVPGSGINDPDKAEFRAAILQLGIDVSSLNAGFSRFTTRAALYASTPPAEGTQARVYADPTAAYNTMYIYRSGAWVVDSDYVNAVATVVQPLVDQANAAKVAAQTAQAAAEAAAATSSSAAAVVQTNVLGQTGPAMASPATYSGLPLADVAYDTNSKPVESTSVTAGVERDKLFSTPNGLISKTQSWDALPNRQTGNVLALPIVRLLNSNGATILTKAGAITCLPPTIVNIASEAFSLSYNNPRFLAYATIGGALNVTRVSDGVLLTEGTHYSVERVTGKMWGLVNTADFNVTIQYNPYPVRVDYVVTDQYGHISLVQGTPAPRIAKEPAVSSPYRKLFRIYRTFTYSDVMAVYAYQGAARAAEPQEYYGRIARHKGRLERLKRTKLRYGQTVKWGAYGDSITAMGGGSGIYTGTTPNNININPNTHRDTIGYYANYDATARADIPVYYYDEIHPDATELAALQAAGYLTSSGGHLQDVYGQTHTKAGYNWSLLEWIKSNYGVTVNYRNWGIGGTNSQNSVLSSGAMNMRYATRLNAILADGLDVVNICTGMNELGQAYTYDNLKAIGQAFRSAGTEVIFWTPVRTNPVYENLFKEWAFTCAEIERVADDLDCACVQSALLFADNKLSGWLSKDEMCAATAQNHPGVRETDALAYLAIDLFK